MKILKKFLVVFLAGCSVALSLFGCSVSSASGDLELPADGVVKQSVFENAKKNSQMLTIHGKSGDFSYSWFFDGASISAPSDQNLKVDLADAGDSPAGAVSSSEVVRLRFHESRLIQAKTTLRIDFPKLLDARTVRLYRKGSGEIDRLLEAPLNNDKISSVTFPVSGTDGDFYLAAMDPSFREDPSKVASDLQSGSGTASAGASSSSVDAGSAASAGGPERKGAGSQNPAAKAGSAPKASSPSAGAGGKDRYQTDSTPPGRPKPVEPQEVHQNTRKADYCTLSIDCKTILNNMDRLNRAKKSVLPADGTVFQSKKVLFYQGESVFDVLVRETKKNKIQMEYKTTPAYNSSYIEGIHNLYEFDCGSLSGWMYQVNGWYPNYGCSRYLLKNGDTVSWRYTCDLGRDVGCGWNVSQK